MYIVVEDHTNKGVNQVRKIKTTTIVKLCEKVEETGKPVTGWFKTFPSDVPILLKAQHPKAKAWVEKVKVFPRKKGFGVCPQREWRPIFED